MRKEVITFEKVNPMHPDKIADRIAGALVDLAYKKDENPKCAVEVLLGHDECNILGECSVNYSLKEVEEIVERITKNAIHKINLKITKQDKQLAKNQNDKIRCGDNGIFKAVLPSQEERVFTELMYRIYDKFNSDGKGFVSQYYDAKKGLITDITICQSQASNKEIENIIIGWSDEQASTFLIGSQVNYKINPIGYWTGGLNVDSGATNRKLGSDMGRSITGGGLCGKDYSKADLSINVFLHLLANKNDEEELTSFCSISDEKVKVISEKGKITEFEYSFIVDYVKDYIKQIGGFEKFAEWGLIRPIL